MRAFVKMRELIDDNKELKMRLDKMEGKYDKQFQVVFEAIRRIMNPPVPRNPRKIGFRKKKGEET